MPPAKWSRCLGSFPYCPGLSFLDARLAGFLEVPFVVKRASWLPLNASPTHQARGLSGPLWVAHFGLPFSTLLPHQATTDLRQDTSSAPRFCTLL